MRIETYFAQVRQIIEGCPFVASPHHKHAGSEEDVVAASEPDLPAVLREIEALVQLP